MDVYSLSIDTHYSDAKCLRLVYLLPPPAYYAAPVSRCINALAGACLSRDKGKQHQQRRRLAGLGAYQIHARLRQGPEGAVRSLPPVNTGSRINPKAPLT
jgi:hypothetical protein